MYVHTLSGSALQLFSYRFSISSHYCFCYFDMTLRFFGLRRNVRVLSSISVLQCPQTVFCKSTRHSTCVIRTFLVRTAFYWLASVLSLPYLPALLVHNSLEVGSNIKRFACELVRFLTWHMRPSVCSYDLPSSNITTPKAPCGRPFTFRSRWMTKLSNFMHQTTWQLRCLSTHLRALRPYRVQYEHYQCRENCLAPPQRMSCHL